MLKRLFNNRYPKAILFDLDGTLINTLEDLSHAVDMMLQQLGYNRAGTQRVGLWVGNGSQQLVIRALAHAQQCTEQQLSKEVIVTACNIFNTAYAQTCGRYSVLYPQVYETLSSLYAENIQLCLITNKAKRFTPKILSKHNLSGFFQEVISGDSLAQQKPHPAPLLHALELLSTSNTEALMVGDSRNDIVAAQAAEIKSVCVSYGYNYGKNSRELAATAHIDQFNHLLDS